MGIARHRSDASSHCCRNGRRRLVVFAGLAGEKRSEFGRWWLFNLRQIGLVLITLASLGVLIVAVGAGLLGNPEMFIIGNGSSRSFLQWFQPRAASAIPQPMVVSISIWFYRLLMLFWALWLASALLRWLTDGWKQFSHGGAWRHKPIIAEITDAAVVTKHELVSIPARCRGQWSKGQKTA